MTLRCDTCRKLMLGSSISVYGRCPRCDTGTLYPARHPSIQDLHDHECSEGMR